MSNLEQTEKTGQELIEEKVSSIDKFFNENKKIIISGLCVIAVAYVAFLGWHKFYVNPLKAEARGQMIYAEASFRAHNYDLALNGDGNSLGFSQIIEKYGNKAGEAVFFYTGVCHLQLGNFEKAVEFLKKYNGKDKILKARAVACIGDAYVGLNKYDESLSYFEKAAKIADNDFAASYLLKAGIVCEELGNNQKALTFYKDIKKKYPNSVEGFSIDKYISRIENSSK